MKNLTKTIRIPILSAVFAGSSIPDDWQKWEIAKFRDVREIPNIGQNEKCVGIPVIGDSLKNVGIYHGDILVIKLTDNCKAGKLCVWQTPHGRTAKYARENFDGSVTLHNKNGWKQNWQPEDVQLVGVVVRVERDMD